MLAADPFVRSRDIKHYTDFSAMTLHRHIRAGRFPSAAATIKGICYWSRSDLVAWRDGRRCGWPPDPDIAARPERMAPVRAARTQKLSELAMSHPSVTHLSIPKVAILEGICRGVVIVDGIKAAPLLRPTEPLASRWRAAT